MKHWISCFAGNNSDVSLLYERHRYSRLFKIRYQNHQLQSFDFSPIALITSVCWYPCLVYFNIEVYYWMGFLVFNSQPKVFFRFSTIIFLFCYFVYLTRHVTIFRRQVSQDGLFLVKCSSVHHIFASLKVIPFFLAWTLYFSNSCVTAHRDWCFEKTKYNLTLYL